MIEHMVPGSTEFLPFKTWWRDKAELTAWHSEHANSPVHISADQLTDSGYWFGVNQQLQYDDVAVV